MDLYRDAARIEPVDDGGPVAAVEYLLDAINEPMPDEFYDDENGLRVSYAIEEQTVDLEDCYPHGEYLPIDSESLHTSYAFKTLAGDPDLHGRNIQICDDGSTYPHDFALAGKYDLQTLYNQLKKSITGKAILNPSFMTLTPMQFGLGIDGRLSPHGLRQKLNSMADEIDQDSLMAAYEDDDRITFDPDKVDDPETSAEQIVANLQEAQERSYTNIIEDLYDTVRQAV